MATSSLLKREALWLLATAAAAVLLTLALERYAPADTTIREPGSLTAGDPKIEARLNHLYGPPERREARWLALKFGVPPSEVEQNLEEFRRRDAALEASPVARSPTPRGLEWLAPIGLLYALTLSARVFAWCAVWTIRGGLRRFRYWPELLVTIGTCAVSWGLAHRADDGDRLLVTAGAGVIAGTLMTLARR